MALLSRRNWWAAWIPDPVAVRMLLAEMNTNVEDDPRGAQPLRIEQAHVVAGILHVPQVSHEGSA